MRRFLVTGLALLFAGAVRGGEKGTEITIDGLKSTTPETWNLKEAKVPFRLHTFILPKAKGDERDAELVVSFTGKGSGGEKKGNITRWQGMFLPPKGKTIDEATKIEEIKVGSVPVTIVTVEGTYKEKFPPFAPDAKVTLRPDYKRVNVIFDSENGPFFIYLLGPTATVTSHQAGFEKWLKGFK